MRAMPAARPAVHAPSRNALAAVLLLARPWRSSRRPGGIYTCIDDKGRRLTSDRPIAECNAREQQILNRDGSVQGRASRRC
jgi:hypothetical protein